MTADSVHMTSDESGTVRLASSLFLCSGQRFFLKCIASQKRAHQSESESGLVGHASLAGISLQQVEQQENHRHCTKRIG